MDAPDDIRIPSLAQRGLSYGPTTRPRGPRRSQDSAVALYLINEVLAQVWCNSLLFSVIIGSASFASFIRPVPEIDSQAKTKPRQSAAPPPARPSSRVVFVKSCKLASDISS